MSRGKNKRGGDHADDVKKGAHEELAANPFEKYDLDPSEGPTAITERLRELAEDATCDEERDEIRAAWEELTMHPLRRLRAAFRAHPEHREPLPRRPRARRAARSTPEPLALLDLWSPPELHALFEDDAALPDLPLVDDPALKP